MSELIINTYPEFETNQVLTSSQLNELSEYLDQQTRQTRVRLIGIGIVCGLEPSFVLDSPPSPPPADNGTVTISAGTGITSEGYLINIGDTSLTQYRAYTIPALEYYPPFLDPSTNDQVTLWEMLPASYVPVSGDPPVERITQTFLQGTSPGDQKIALLFLEIVDVPNQSCLGKSCNDLGSERTLTLRRLLISVNDLDIVLANTGVFNLTYTGKYDLPDLAVLRALFDSTTSGTTDYFIFSQQYKTAVSNVYTQSQTNPLDILKVLSQTYTIFQPILQDIYGNVNPFDPSQIPAISTWNGLLNGSPAEGPPYLGIQYFYDFIKDLILAYDEFVDAAFDLMSDCCFDTGLFPQHLLLGEAIPVSSCKPSQYRDDFVSVPLTEKQRVAKQKLVVYHMRIVLMIREFNVDLIHNPNLAALPPVLITPSNEKMSKLSQRAIPYYYKLNDVDSQLNTTLEAVWNFELIERCKGNGNVFPVVAYGNQSLNQNTPIDPVQTPFFYDIDKYNFYRIEGQLQANYNDVIADLNARAAQFNLPFNVVAVRLQGVASSADILSRCNFEDLRSQYVAYRNTFYCRMMNLYNYLFITTVQGEPTSTTTAGTGNPTARTTVTSSTEPRQLPDFIRQMANDAANTQRGSSSVAFMPTVFIQPGATAPQTPYTPPLQYTPRLMSQISSDYSSNINLLLTTMNNLIDLLPETLDDFEYGYGTDSTAGSFINTFIEAVQLCNKIKANINEMLDQVLHSTKNTFTKEMYFALSQWASEYFYMLNEFVLNCSFHNLEAVYYELQYRISYLQQNDPTLFSNFVAQNPGIDHKAGVQPGGTFVLLYPGTALTFEIKSKIALADTLKTIKVLQVQQSILLGISGKTPAQVGQLAEVNRKLCNLYATQATSPRPRPLQLGTAAPSISIQQIQIDPDAVIADFSLPYLSNCNCDCLDIPTPTSIQLGIPAVAMPVFYEYDLGDYAFAKDSVSSTNGCPNPIPVTIDISKSINYITQRKGKDGVEYVRLKFVVSGLSQDYQVNVQNPPALSITTAKGGTVSIITLGDQPLVQGFRYIPARGYAGIDSFEYVFEIYDSSSNVQLRSNKATVTISVTGSCPSSATTSGTTSVQQFIAPIV